MSKTGTSVDHIVGLPMSQASPDTQHVFLADSPIEIEPINSTQPGVEHGHMESTRAGPQYDDVVVVDVEGTIDRSRRVYIGALGFPAPVEIEGVVAEDYRVIERMPWFIRSALLRDGEDVYSACPAYAYEGIVFWRVLVEAFRTAVWKSFFAVYDIDFRTTNWSVENRRFSHVREAHCSVESVLREHLINPALVCDIWYYVTNGHVPYVGKLMSLPEEHLCGCRGKYMVHVVTICFDKAHILADFRYISREKSDYRNHSVRFEHRCLSVLGKFVPHIYRMVFGLTETARDRLLVNIPP